MELPLQITFHGINGSDPITDKVRSRAQKLGKFFDRIRSCRVAIEAPHRHHTKGNQYRVRIEVSVPGQQLVVTRGQDGREAHADLNVTIRDAFDAMRRQLEDYAALLRSGMRLQTGPAESAR